MEEQILIYEKLIEDMEDRGIFCTITEQAGVDHGAIVGKLVIFAELQRTRNRAT